MINRARPERRPALSRGEFFLRMAVASGMLGLTATGVGVFLLDRASQKIDTVKSELVKLNDQAGDIKSGLKKSGKQFGEGADMVREGTASVDMLRCSLYPLADQFNVELPQDEELQCPDIAEATDEQTNAADPEVTIPITTTTTSAG